MKILKTCLCFALAAVVLLSACSCGVISGNKKQTAEVKTLNPDLKYKVRIKETEAPDGFDGQDEFETAVKWYDVGSEGYDGLPLSGDVLLTVSMPGKADNENLGSYVFIYYDEGRGEYRYLFPDSYDLSSGTMTIDLPHFSKWGTAKQTEKKQIEEFLNSYSTKLAVERGKQQQAAEELEPYVRAKVEAMGLTKQAAEDLIQSTVNYLGSRFTGGNAKYIETGTKYTTTLIRGYYDGDKDAAMNGIEDVVTDAVVNCWSDLGYTDNLNDVMENGFVGDTTEKLLSSTNGIARMAGNLASGTEEGFREAMKELGGVMKGVHPAVELTTNAVAYLGAKVNEEFTNWKSNQVEELYQIYKNGAEDIWGNYVVAGDRVTFLEYLNTSSGFTMAKGVNRFYNLDKVGEICEKYGWPYSSYEELPERYRDIFRQRAEDGLMKYFEMRLQQEKTAEQIKATERVCIETMMNKSYGALHSSNFGKFFGEQSAEDYNVTNRLERLVKVRSILSQYVNEEELNRLTKAGSFNWGDLLNSWAADSTSYPREEALQRFLKFLQERNLLKAGMEKLIRDGSAENKPDTTEQKDGYWKLKETNTASNKDEIGTDGYASWYYSASELTHTTKVSLPKTDYHGEGNATMTVSCSAPPRTIYPGDDVIILLTEELSCGGDYLLWSMYGAVGYGEPNDERNGIMYNNPTRFEATDDSPGNRVYLDTMGNTPCPKAAVHHAFGKGSRNGEEMAILFSSGAGNTLWIYEWVEEIS